MYILPILLNQQYLILIFNIRWWEYCTAWQHSMKLRDYLQLPCGSRLYSSTTNQYVALSLVSIYFRRLRIQQKWANSHKSFFHFQRIDQKSRLACNSKISLCILLGYNLKESDWSFQELNLVCKFVLIFLVTL